LRLRVLGHRQGWLIAQGGQEPPAEAWSRT
jgi:hypothetical protein